MKQARHLAPIAALVFSCAANDASGQAISNVPIPPGTVLGNLQGTHSGASALTFNELKLALSQNGALLTPPPTSTPGHAVIFGSDPANPGITADAGGAPLLAPLANVSLATMPAFTLKGNATGSAAVPTDISIPALTQKATPVSGDLVMISDSAAANALKYATVSSLASVGAVSSIAGNTGPFTLGTGLSNLVNDLRVSLSALTTSLGADVALNNTSNYFDGPSVGQGTTGTWWAAGTVTIKDTAGIAQIMCKLWDGTTVIASGDGTVPSASTYVAISLHGYLASPAGNIRISCKDITSTSGAFVFNQTSNSKDSTISVHRIQ